MSAAGPTKPVESDLHLSLFPAGQLNHNLPGRVGMGGIRVEFMRRTYSEDILGALGASSGHTSYEVDTAIRP